MALPEAIFRNALDLNRYSNKVSTDIARRFVDICVDSVQQIASLERVGLGDSYRANRLRSIVAQMEKSLSGWKKYANKHVIGELQELAKVEAGFIENQLEKLVPSAAKANLQINGIQISPKFAESIVTVDPTKIKSRAVGQQLARFLGETSLSDNLGAAMSLPNGNIMQQAFNRIAENSVQLFRSSVEDGLLVGESTAQITRRLLGNSKAKDTANILQMAQKGGILTTPPINQVRTLVRTSINQVSNTAALNVYKANSDVTKKYRYVATLDSRTSAVCSALDGRIFTYEDGPKPPQHFNCRSTIVPEIDYDNLPFDPPKGIGQRPSDFSGIAVKMPASMNYGEWLLAQPNKIQAQILGGKLNKATNKYEGAFRYFQRLAGKENDPRQALAKFVRADGSRITLTQLKARYGKPENIPLTPIGKPVETAVATAKKTRTAITSPTMTTEGVDTWLETNKLGDIQEFLESSLDSVEKLGGLTATNVKKMRTFMKKGKIVSQFNMQNEKTMQIASLGERFLKGKNLKAFAESNKTVVKRFDWINNNLPEKSISANTRDWQKLWNGSGIRRLGHKNLFENSIKSLEAGGSILSQPEDFTRKVSNYLFGNATGGTHGYTIFNSAMVHTRLKTNARKIGNIAARNIRASVQETLETNFKFSKFKGTKYERYRQGIEQGIREVWSNSAPLDGDADWFVTFVHEMGHQIHYQSGAASLGQQFRKLGGMTYPTEYSRKNALEQFTESFVQYVFNPEGLQERAPRLYKWVDETLEQSLKNL
jgi:SPP1 gp7 family putative phage head morphogenesis protein